MARDDGRIIGRCGLDAVQDVISRACAVSAPCTCMYGCLLYATSHRCLDFASVWRPLRNIPTVHAMPRRAERRASDRASAALDSKPGPSNRYLQALVAVTILLLSAWWAGQSLLLRASDGRCFFLLRFLFWMLLDGAFSENCAAALLLPARYIARRIPGASHTMPPPHEEAALAEQEAQKHDMTLEWPPSDAKLPAEWKQQQQQQRRSSPQPFFLNHATATP